MIFLDIATTVCIGLLIGTEFTVSVFINPVLKRLDTGTRMKTISFSPGGSAQRCRSGMRLAFYCSSLKPRSAWHGGSEALLITAGAFWLAVIVLTLIFLVPINNRMMRLDANSGADSSLQEHRKWDLLHRGRVAVLATSMVCFLLAVLR